MDIAAKVIGGITTVIGIGILYIDYFIVKTIWVIGIWLTETMNAPIEVVIGIIVIIIILLIKSLAFVAILGTLVVLLGISIALDLDSAMKSIKTKIWGFINK